MNADIRSRKLALFFLGESNWGSFIVKNHLYTRFQSCHLADNVKPIGKWIIFAPKLDNSREMKVKEGI